MLILPTETITMFRINNPKYFEVFPDKEWRKKFLKPEEIKDKDIFHCFLLPDNKNALLLRSIENNILLFSYTLLNQSSVFGLRKTVQLALLDTSGNQVYVYTIGFVDYENSNKKLDNLISSKARTIVKTMSKIVDKKSCEELRYVLEDLCNKAFKSGLIYWSKKK